MSELIQIHITYPNLNLAQSVGEELVRLGLVACAQTTPIQSIYEWQGKVESEPEIRLELKTLSKHYDHIADWIETHHPYDVPQITASTIAQCNVQYANWVKQQCIKKV